MGGGQLVPWCMEIGEISIKLYYCLLYKLPTKGCIYPLHMRTNRQAALHVLFFLEADSVTRCHTAARADEHLALCPLKKPPPPPYPIIREPPPSLFFFGMQSGVLWQMYLLQVVLVANSLILCFFVQYSIAISVFKKKLGFVKLGTAISERTSVSKHHLKQ